MEQFIAFLAEDWVGLLINTIFAAMIIPMIFDRQKPPLVTSLVTGSLLIALALNGSYRAAAPAVMVFVGGVLWLVLAYQRWKQKH